MESAKGSRESDVIGHWSFVCPPINGFYFSYFSPNLGWRDVQHLIARSSCSQFSSVPWITNKAGIKGIGSTPFPIHSIFRISQESEDFTLPFWEPTFFLCSYCSCCNENFQDTLNRHTLELMSHLICRMVRFHKKPMPCAPISNMCLCFKS